MEITIQKEKENKDIEMIVSENTKILANNQELEAKVKWLKYQDLQTEKLQLTKENERKSPQTKMNRRKMTVKRLRTTPGKN